MIPILELAPKPAAQSTAPRKSSALRRWLVRVHDLLALSALSIAIVQLAIIPNAKLEILAYFIPPLIAAAMLLVNRCDPFLLAACRLFLSLLALAVTAAELTVSFPFPKPQFPGLPLLADRILAYYFVAYGLFLWIICPGYVLAHWFRHWMTEQPKRVFGTLFLLTAWATWLGTTLALAIAIVIGRHRLF